MTRSGENQILMARQPIFDRNQKVVAYELLYRNDESTENAVFRDSSATTEVVLNAYTSISDAGAVKRVPAFINITRDLLLDGNFPELPKKFVVLEIPADVVVDESLIRAVRELVRDGYRVSLDNFSYTPAYEALLKLVQMVKLDVSDQTKEQLQEHLKRLQPFKVTPIAVKIESHSKLEECELLGFKLFQGHFLSQPKLVKGRKVGGSEMALMQLIQELQKPNTTPEALETVIIRDPVLTYKLLRIVNSAAYALVRKVESIAEAVVLLGMEQIRRWSTLIAMTSHQDKPEELSRILLIRGRMCETIAVGLKYSNHPSFFMAGMMSGLAALLDIDQESMLAEVPLGEDIKLAITEYKGLMGEVLNNVINYESGDWDQLPDSIDIDLYESAYRDSLQWTQESMLAMHNQE